MLWDASAITGYAIEASDGQIGSVSDMLFEDVNWTLRWLVVDTGNWLSGRKVLLPVSALGHPDRASRNFTVKLTMDQVRHSPDIDTEASVSRQNEAHVYDYYGLDPYWGGGLYPISNAMAVPFLAPLAPDERRALDAADVGNVPEATGLHEAGDPHLRSIESVTGYHIHASDGEIGHVEDFLIDDIDWNIQYLTVDTANWWFGNRVLIAPKMVQKIDWAERMIDLNVERQKVRDAPPYDPNMTVDGAFDEKFVGYYGF